MRAQYGAGFLHIGLIGLWSNLSAFGKPLALSGAGLLATLAVASVTKILGSGRQPLHQLRTAFAKHVNVVHRPIV